MVALESWVDRWLTGTRRAHPRPHEKGRNGYGPLRRGGNARLHASSEAFDGAARAAYDPGRLESLAPEPKGAVLAKLLSSNRPSFESMRAVLCAL